MKILGSTNLSALLCVCQARRRRVSKLSRQRRLGVISRRIDRAYQVARSRAWLEEFIGVAASDNAREKAEDA